jgi:hypothetical protein
MRRWTTSPHEVPQVELSFVAELTLAPPKAFWRLAFQC